MKSFNKLMFFVLVIFVLLINSGAISAVEDTNITSSNNSSLNDNNVLNLDENLKSNTDDNLTLGDSKVVSNYSNSSEDENYANNSKNLKSSSISNSTSELSNSNSTSASSSKTVLKVSKMTYKNMTTFAILDSDVRNGKYFEVNLTDAAGNPLKNESVLIGFNGKIYNRTSNSTGGVKLQINLASSGVYTFALCFLGDKDYYGSFFVSKITVLKNNLSLTNSYNVTKNTTITNGVYETYSKYGVSSDGSKLMAIGRPSACGELSKYGYKFYKTVFVRICPHCKSTELYWSIFWSGDETTSWGVFPATGRKEGGSCEGQIFCKNCDADYSVITGTDHGNSKYKLTIFTNPVKSTKTEAYKLKNGKFVIDNRTYTTISTIKLNAILKTTSGILLVNKTVKFTIDGKTYSVKTNTKGLASITVSLTANKTYAYSIKFAGDNQNNAITKSGKLVLD